LIVAVSALLASACAFASPASAGGAVWDFDRPYYEPGDIVRAATSVGWGHNDQLGTPDDGPYGVWIQVWTGWAAGAAGESLAEQIESARYVTDVRIELGPQVLNGFLQGPNIARVEFRLPAIAPGLYALLHCNDPCTTPLGDITWGHFWVGPPQAGLPFTSGQEPPSPPPNPPTTAVTLPPATATIPPAASTAAATKTAAAGRDRAGAARDVPAGLIGSAVVAVGAGVAIAIMRRRRGRARHPV
jgi:hypothetical protein